MGYQDNDDDYVVYSDYSHPQDYLDNREGCEPLNAHTDTRVYALTLFAIALVLACLLLPIVLNGGFGR